MDITSQNLLNLIEPFCIEYKIGKTQFGKLACGNQNFIKDLREGVSPTGRTAEKVKEFINKYKRDKDREMKRFFK